MSEHIKQFDKSNLKFIRSEIQATLDLFKDEYGLTLTIGGISYSAGKFTTRMTATVDGFVDEIPKASVVTSFPGLFDLPGDVVGRQFMFKNNLYTVTGLKSSRPKYPVTAKRADGKQFKFPVHIVKKNLM